MTLGLSKPSVAQSQTTQRATLTTQDWGSGATMAVFRPNFPWQAEKRVVRAAALTSFKNATKFLISCRPKRCRQQCLCHETSCHICAIHISPTYNARQRKTPPYNWMTNEIQRRRTPSILGTSETNQHDPQIRWCLSRAIFSISLTAMHENIVVRIGTNR